MANTAGSGFRFYKMRNGSSTPYTEVFPVASAYGTGLFRGDPVKLLSDGTIAVAAAGDTDVLGVACGVPQYKAADGFVKQGTYLPASTSHSGLGTPNCSMVRVILARDAIFEVDADDGSTVTTVAGALNMVGENANHIATAAGSTTTGLSGYNLDISDHTTGAAQWRIVGVSSAPDNDVTATRAKYLVVLNEGSQPPFSTTGI
jgi:hypothetical protein